MRTAQLDADHRREPKGTEWCARCYKTLKEGQPRRYVTIQDWSFATVIHPDDCAGYDWDHAPGMFPVGMDCAKKIGMEFTKELSPI